MLPISALLGSFVRKEQNVPSPAAKWTNPAKAEYGSEGVTDRQLVPGERRQAYGYRR